MKKVLVLMVSIMLTCATIAVAQNNPAAVIIANASQPNKTIFDDFTTCVKDLTQLGMKVGKAADKCAQVRDREARRGEKVANEAADATKNNWPKPPAYNSGYGYGGGGWSAPR